MGFILHIYIIFGTNLLTGAPARIAISYVNMNFYFELFGSEHSCHNKENYIMLGSIPHQKFCFYHLPTRGRAGSKLGDA